MIDIGSVVGKYQKVFCSDYFSSIELIPLETNSNSLIILDLVYGYKNERAIQVNDSLIFILSDKSQSNVIRFPLQRDLFVFDRTGKFQRQIGSIGQGPGEFSGINDYLINPEKPTVFIDDYHRIFEYEFSGKFVNSFPKPKVDDRALSFFTYVEDDKFIGSIPYRHFNTNKLLLFNRKGDVIKSFPSLYYFESNVDKSLTTMIPPPPFRIGERLFLKDEVNDTIYSLKNLSLQPFCVFDFGKYSIKKGEINKEGKIKIIPDEKRDYSGIRDIVGTPRYYFYTCHVRWEAPRPKVKSVLHFGRESFPIGEIHGIYDFARNKNILLDTDRHLQKGIINDIDGGLPIIPRYYTGNNEIVDIWNAYEMLEMLTEEYFSNQKIKDLQAHEKLKELLKTLKEDDNPVVVVAKLK